MPFVMSMRRQHLDNTTFFVFPKRVILKRENTVTQAQQLIHCQEVPATCINKCYCSPISINLVGLVIRASHEFLQLISTNIDHDVGVIFT